MTTAVLRTEIKGTRCSNFRHATQQLVIIIIIIIIIIVVVVVVVVVAITCHPVAVFLTLVQTKQIRIIIHKRNNTKDSIYKYTS